MSNYFLQEPNEFQFDDNLNSSSFNLLNSEFSNHINNALDIENNFLLDDESKDLSTGITNLETKKYIGNKRYPEDDVPINDLKDIKSIINKNKSEDLNLSIKKQKGFNKKIIPKKKVKLDLMSQKNKQNVHFDGTVKKVKKKCCHYILKSSN